MFLQGFLFLYDILKKIIVKNNIIWFQIQTVKNKWNCLIETPRVWSWKDVGFVITDKDLFKRLNKFANFQDFKGIIEKEFKTPIESLIRFERLN